MSTIINGIEAFTLAELLAGEIYECFFCGEEFQMLGTEPPHELAEIDDNHAADLWVCPPCWRENVTNP